VKPEKSGAARDGAEIVRISYIVQENHFSLIRDPRFYVARGGHGRMRDIRHRYGALVMVRFAQGLKLVRFDHPIRFFSQGKGFANFPEGRSALAREKKPLHAFGVEPAQGRDRVEAAHAELSGQLVFHGPKHIAGIGPAQGDPAASRFASSLVK
jgi:hypothetical protein